MISQGKEEGGRWEADIPPQRMARGKKTKPEDIYAIMASYAVTGNCSETARELNIPSSTVYEVVEKNSWKPEFVKRDKEQKEKFAQRATGIINLAMDRLEGTLEDEEKDIPVNHLTTVIGTMYDKRALATGESTENTTVEVKLPPGFDDYAG